MTQENNQKLHTRPWSKAS